MPKINPCLWLHGQAEEAAQFYTSIFKNSQILKTARYDKATAQAIGVKEDSVLSIEFKIEGNTVFAMNGNQSIKHTPAMSFFLGRNSQSDVMELWEKLSQGGEVRMGLDKYPWATLYGWTADKFGVEWQIMLSETGNTVCPCFLFVDELFGKAEAAMNFYMSIFDNSKVDFIAKDKQNNSLMYAAFHLDKTCFSAMDGGGGPHNYTFSQAFSLIVYCETQSQIDQYWAKLTEGGNPDQCGWLKDKYGVWWQVVPAELVNWVSDPKRSQAVLKELLPMKKVDLSKLKSAFEQG